MKPTVILNYAQAVEWIALHDEGGVKQQDPSYVIKMATVKLVADLVGTSVEEVTKAVIAYRKVMTNGN